MPTGVKGDDGEIIWADRCPHRLLTARHRELIHSASILVEYGVPAVAGGQEDQPIGFFEVAAMIKSYHTHLQNEANRNAKT